MMDFTTASSARRRVSLALALVGGALALAYVARATPTQPADSATAALAPAGLSLNRNLNATQAAHGLRYQCMQNLRVCARGIAVSSTWTADLAQQIFDAEYQSCCYEAILCGDFLSSLGNRTITIGYDEDIFATCQAVDVEPALSATVDGRRLALQADAGTVGQ